MPGFFKPEKRFPGSAIRFPESGKRETKHGAGPMQAAGANAGRGCLRKNKNT